MNKEKLVSFGKVLGFAIVFQLVSLISFGQDPKGVNVRARNDRTESDVKSDKQYCHANTEAQFDNTDHKTAKNTGVGAGAGAVGGAIIGKPGLGAVIGGGAGAVRGHRKSNKDKNAFNQVYASCMRDKGYEVDTYDD